MKKFYAVKSGRKTGIFDTWKECEEQVRGFSSAVYKSFTSLEAARDFLAEGDSPQVEPENTTSHVFESQTQYVQNSQEKAIAYVDGSFDGKSNVYGSGAVLFYCGEKFAYSKAGNDEKLLGMRNVAGEILAAQAVMKYCISKGIKYLDIYYDYQGIEAWADGSWKTNRLGTREYKRFCDEAFQKLNVKFIKVKAHSNDVYNDEADSLAKKSIEEYIAEYDVTKS